MRILEEEQGGGGQGWAGHLVENLVDGQRSERSRDECVERVYAQGGAQEVLGGAHGDARALPVERALLGREGRDVEPGQILEALGGHFVHGGEGVGVRLGAAKAAEDVLPLAALVDKGGRLNHFVLVSGQV